MWRISFTVMAAMPAVVTSQTTAIPGRDLLAFPLGRAAEAGALATSAGSGFWNPATAVLEAGVRWRLGAAAMSGPADLAVSAQVGSVAGRWKHTTWAFTVVHAAVDGLPRTDSDPLAVGGEVPYSTLVVSVVAARRLTPGVVAGVAVRARNGRLDDVSRTGASVDAGILADHLGPLDARVGVSTLLFSPWRAGAEHTSLLAAADMRVFSVDTSRTLRAGYGMQHTSDTSTEQYAFAAARWGAWEARGGPVRTEAYGASNWRARLGIAVRHSGYTVGVSREGSAGGLAPTFHFSLSAALP